MITVQLARCVKRRSTGKEERIRFSLDQRDGGRSSAGWGGGCRVQVLGTKQPASTNVQAQLAAVGVQRRLANGAALALGVADDVRTQLEHHVPRGNAHATREATVTTELSEGTKCHFLSSEKL